MGVTSKKLYSIKNDVLRKSISNIDVESDEELLLLEAPSKYDEVYRTLGVKSKQDFVSDQLKDSREIKVFQDKYKNAEAFKGSHIKKLCNTYDLMILPISNIKGYLGDEAMKAILDFTNEFKNTLLSESHLYILTGREYFYDESKGKEVKTFIIFYKDGSNDSGTSSRKLRKGDVVNQLYSSGNDFSNWRVFSQLFIKRRYSGGDGMPRYVSNLLITLILALSIGLMFVNLIASTIFLTIYLIAMWLNNSDSTYKSCWNNYYERHGYYL